MLDLNKSVELSRAFEPGIGDEPERDNLAGGLATGLKYAIDKCLKVFCFNDARYMDKDVLTAICNASEWIEDCIRELNE